MAQCLEQQLNNQSFDRSVPRGLLTLLDQSQAEVQGTFSEREVALLRMTRTIASLLDRLQNEVASEPLYAIG
jgi:multidrug resistance protein MdtO